MKLEERKFAEQQRQAQFDRHKELIALEAEYGALMGQETKAPTDPRLTQTHKVATMKGQYGRQGDVAKRMTERQKRNLDLMKLIQKGDHHSEREKRLNEALAETVRHHKVTEAIGRSRAASAGRLRDSFNSQRTIQALNGLLGKIDTELRAAAGTSQAPGRQGIDDERVKRLMAERDKVAALLKNSIAQATRMSGVAAQLGAMDTGGVPGMEAYGTGMGGGAPQGGGLDENDPYFAFTKD